MKAVPAQRCTAQNPGEPCDAYDGREDTRNALWSVRTTELRAKQQDQNITMKMRIPIRENRKT
jgi:hypothetical protein